jgi:beta-glucanase (GH16 family)
MESDDLDEIDWEWLGGDLTEVETNYFGKGNTTTYDRATYVPVSSPQATFHTYTIEWKSSAITWAIDGTIIRTLPYAAANGGANFPQTPMQVKLGNWVGGSSTAPKGTVEWAGGLTDFKEAPFTMYVKSLTVQDYSTGGASYVYSDMSGDWQSIKTSDEAGGDDSSSSSSASADSTQSSVKASSTVSSATTTLSTATKSTDSGSATPTSAGATNLGAGAVVSTTLSSADATGTSSPTGSSASSSSSSATATPNAASHNNAAQFAVAGLGLLGYLAM